MNAPHAPLWSRHRFRWANGVGFALTFFFALWLLVFVLALVQAKFADLAFPVPIAFVIVGGLALIATIALLGVVLFGYAWKGADLGEPRPRLLLFVWTCAGGIFFLSQGMALLRFGAGSFPHIPSWLSELYWYFSVVGALTFGLLLWVNAEGHHYPWEAADEDDEHAYLDEEHEHEHEYDEFDPEDEPAFEPE